MKKIKADLKSSTTATLPAAAPATLPTGPMSVDAYEASLRQQHARLVEQKRQLAAATAETDAKINAVAGALEAVVGFKTGQVVINAAPKPDAKAEDAKAAA